MEGISHESASLAGHLKLGKIIFFYDDNGITIDGKTSLAFSENIQKRFEAYGWQTLNIDDVNDLSQIDKAVEQAQKETNKPTLIITKTHIGFGSPNKQDTASAHGSPLGEEEIKLTKKNLGWPEDKQFFIPDEVADHFNKMKKSLLAIMKTNGRKNSKATRKNILLMLNNLLRSLIMILVMSGKNPCRRLQIMEIKLQQGVLRVKQ